MPSSLFYTKSVYANFFLSFRFLLNVNIAPKHEMTSKDEITSTSTSQQIKNTNSGIIITLKKTKVRPPKTSAQKIHQLPNHPAFHNPHSVVDTALLAIPWKGLSDNLSTFIINRNQALKVKQALKSHCNTCAILRSTTNTNIYSPPLLEKSYYILNKHGYLYWSQTWIPILKKNNLNKFKFLDISILLLHTIHHNASSESSSSNPPLLQ